MRLPGRRPRGPAHRQAGAGALTEQREWYGGQYVIAASGSQPGRRILPPGDCPVDGCGQEVAGRSVQRRGWVRIHVQGSTMPARTFCSGSCASVGIALAELRMNTPASG